jgi:hypothetical protein
MSVIRQANVGGFLHKDIETYGNLSLTETGKKFLAKPVSIIFSKEREYDGDETPDDEPITGAAAGPPTRSSWPCCATCGTRWAKSSNWHPT